MTGLSVSSVPGISPADARTEIAELIADGLVCAGDLNAALQDERRALEDQDADALHAVVDGKNSCAKELQRLEQKRARLCHEWGFSASPEQMQRVLDWCDDSGQLSHGWRRLMDIAAEGNAMNLTNGAIIRVRQQHTEASLSVLRGAAPGSHTYGQNGAGTGDNSRRTLAEA